jgi:hypothetical protein
MPLDDLFIAKKLAFGVIPTESPAFLPILL